MLSALSLPSSWTKDNFPECTPSPSCYPNRRAPDHGSPLNALFNKWCSDKGTYWLSKHNYGAAYDSVLGPRRAHTLQMLELGVGDETAGSLNAWREYFPKAEFWIAEIDVARFQDKKQWAWASRQKRRHGCFDDPNVWSAPRVHPLFGVDSSNRTQLRNLPLPAEGVDLIIDDGSRGSNNDTATYPRRGSPGPVPSRANRISDRTIRSVACWPLQRNFRRSTKSATWASFVPRSRRSTSKNSSKVQPPPSSSRSSPMATPATTRKRKL